jgi:predicted ArsR family transcriptional regulator
MKPDTDTAARILAAINARSEPLTIKQLAAFTNRSRATVQTAIKPMATSGQVAVVGVRQTGQRGRPAFKYGSVLPVAPSQ